MPAAWVAQGGTFSDQTQQQFAQMLQQGTQGKKDVPLVFYCLSTQCWMSYNGALRAINAGYTNVLWYRGGIEAWKSAGLPTQPAQQQGQGGQRGYQQQPQQQQPNSNRWEGRATRRNRAGSRSSNTLSSSNNPLHNSRRATTLNSACVCGAVD